MLLIILKVLIAIYNGSACQIGQSTDYYAWIDAHPDYAVAHSFEIPSYGDYWLMTADDNEYYLFKFKEPIADTIASGASHGECFRHVN